MRDIVERLKEKIIVDAFVSGSISDGALCDRLIRERLDAADEIVRLRAENETLRRDVKTAVMGDSAELQDVKRENEKLREALKPFADDAVNFWSDVVETPNGSAVGVDVADLRAAAAAIRESGDE